MLAAGLLFGATAEYPSSVGLIDYDRALTALGVPIGVLLLLGAGLVAPPYRGARAALTTVLCLGLLVAHVVAVPMARSASAAAGVGFSQLFASWMPPVTFAAIAIAGMLFAVAPDVRPAGRPHARSSATA